MTVWRLTRTDIHIRRGQREPGCVADVGIITVFRFPGHEVLIYLNDCFELLLDCNAIHLSYSFNPRLSSFSPEFI
ncbi:hypothetical protein HA49_17410 [Tatumella morbirosei]|uniref:Uncharacterized protein n=1 Tax=Tatumella morbirosei TaxID=642227 RepID=A0A095T6D8_9GAMM|nr:hypothetical protein HA49_17410 [Tatumella morbirosei]